MKIPSPDGKPASKRSFLYHFTPKSNAQSIANLGLVPKQNTSPYGAMSPELLGKKLTRRIFLLPILNGVAAESFLAEWWYGEVKDILVLRVPFQHVTDPRQSAESYYAKHEVWTTHPIAANIIDCCLLTQKPWSWQSLGKWAGS
jgi:hypothetical protein